MIRVEIPQGLQNEEWVRMPKPKGRLLGLSRTTLLELAERREIKIANIRKPGSLKGIQESACTVRRLDPSSLAWRPDWRTADYERAVGSEVRIPPHPLCFKIKHLGRKKSKFRWIP